MNRDLNKKLEKLIGKSVLFLLDDGKEVEMVVKRVNQIGIFGRDEQWQRTSVSLKNLSDYMVLDK